MIFVFSLAADVALTFDTPTFVWVSCSVADSHNTLLYVAARRQRCNPSVRDSLPIIRFHALFYFKI